MKASITISPGYPKDIRHILLLATVIDLDENVGESYEFDEIVATLTYLVECIRDSRRWPEEQRAFFEELHEEFYKQLEAAS